MADLIAFVPKSGLAAKINMAAFVQFCRNELTVYGEKLDFDASSWDVGDYYQHRGKSHRVILNFSEHGQRHGVLGRPMPEPFAQQVKAYVRYHVGLKTRRHPPLNEILSFRALLAAFQDKAVEPDLGLIDAHMLDHAVRLATERKPGDYGARIGVYLAPLSRFLREKNLAANAPIDWQHGLEWQFVKKGRLGKAADERRAALLPSAEALQALPEAFRAAKHPRDVIVTSVMALLSCAPSRLNEIFGLAADCEIKPLSDSESGYMLRWAGSKGFHDFAKGIPAVMADVAATAVARLRDHTSEARRIALWYEHNPNRLYLPDDCAHLRGKDLSSADIAKIIGFADAANGRDWAIDHKLKPIEGVRSPKNRIVFEFRFADVEQYILSLLPKGFPVFDRQTGLRYSEALMVVRRQEFADNARCRWRCMIAPATYGNIQHSFHTADNVFARLGFSTIDDPIILRSHQLRHYLNTLAQRGGLSEAEIAAWSGRKDMRQNAVYDHRTPLEILDNKRRRDKDLAAITGARVRVNLPIARAGAGSERRHGHATEIGFCEHDFAASPCAMFMECLHCTKHVCVKGHDPRHAERVAFALNSAKQSLAEAEIAQTRDYEGAEVWIQVHRETIERLEQLHSILTDPQTPDGSMIRLAKSGRYSLVEQAVRDHEQITGSALPWSRAGERAITGGGSDG